MAAISSMGIGSGLDINQLVTDLVAAEREPAENRLDLRQAEYEAKLSGYGALKSALDGFQSSLEGLTSRSSLLDRSATTSDSAVFTASADADAVSGSYDIEVLSTAEAHKLKSTGFADSDTAVGEGTLSLTSGGESFELTIDSSNNTLAGIRDAINSAADNPGVTASIMQVDDGLGGTESKLILTADNPGTDNEITVGGTLAGTLGMEEMVAASDAQIRVDGELATRSSNTIDDVIQGVTLELKADSGGTTETLSIAQDTGGAKQAIGAFVDNYNALIATIGELSKYDAESGEAGILLGDATLRGLQSQLRQGISNPVEDAGDFSTLVEIGITTNRDGTLSLDSGKLDDALAQDAEGVADLFAGSSGVATRLDESVDAYLKDDGIIENKTNGLEGSLLSLEKQREDLDRRMASLEERYTAQFIAMDQAVAGYNSTSDYLTDALANLPGAYDPDK